MIKEIINFVLITIIVIVLTWIVTIYTLVFSIGYILGDDLCSYEKLEQVTSPNEKHIIKTYRENCGATSAFVVIGEVCTVDNKCKEIYTCYREHNSLVYWLDNEKVFINNKILNIKKEKYDWKDDPNYNDNRYIKEESN